MNFMLPFSVVVFVSVVACVDLGFGGRQFEDLR